MWSLTNEHDAPARRERKKERTRQALMDAAIRLIAERGIYGTRVEDITERSDLGKGAFYNYFESKDRLLAELVSGGVELLFGKYVAEISPDATEEERVGAIVAAHAAFFAEHPVYLILFHQVRGLAQVRAPSNEPLVDVFAVYLRRTGAVVAGGVVRPELDEARLMDLAAVVLGAIAGYTSFRRAAALTGAATTVASVLARGVPATMAALPRAVPASPER